jgi:hypothetical protein
MFYHDASGGSSMKYCILLACLAIAIFSADGIWGSTAQGLFIENNAKLLFNRKGQVVEK